MKFVKPFSTPPRFSKPLTGFCGRFCWGSFINPAFMLFLFSFSAFCETDDFVSLRIHHHSGGHDPFSGEYNTYSEYDIDVFANGLVKFHGSFNEYQYIDNKINPEMPKKLKKERIVDKRSKISLDKVKNLIRYGNKLYLYYKKLEANRDLLLENFPYRESLGSTDMTLRYKENEYKFLIPRNVEIIGYLARYIPIAKWVCSPDVQKECVTDYKKGFPKDIDRTLDDNLINADKMLIKR